MQRSPVSCLSASVTRVPDKLAIISGDLQFTFAELGHRVSRLANLIRSRCPEIGARVAYLSRNSHRLFESYFGVPLAGACLLSLHVKLHVDELCSMVKVASPRLLFYEPEFKAVAEALKDRCESLTDLICLDDFEYETLLADASPKTPPQDWNENSAAALFFTSGTEGAPKAVHLSHRALYLHACSLSKTYDDPETMVNMLSIPLYHANGWGHPHASALAGVTQVSIQTFDPVTVLRLITQHCGTQLSLVPAMASRLVDDTSLSRHDATSLREIEIGGSPVSLDLLEQVRRAFRCNVYTGYGLTEAGPTVAKARRHATGAAALRLYPIPGVRVMVVDESGEVVPQNGLAVGEVWVSSPASCLDAAEDWLESGDLAVCLEDGSFQIVDRAKNIIISGGENISAVEVEQHISAHSKVEECAVVAHSDPTWGETPLAIVVLRDGCALSADDLISFLMSRMTSFKVPRLYRFVDGPLPRTGTGKLRRSEIS